MARGGTAIWVERVALVALGALLYAVVRPAVDPATEAVSKPNLEPEAPAAAEAPDPEAPRVAPLVSSVARDDAGPPTEGTPRPPAEDPPATETPVPAEERSSAPASDAPVARRPQAGPLAREAATAGSFRRPRTDPPPLPLPRMPGANQLRAGSKWDSKRGAWVLTRAYEVPAARAHVAAFYRGAIEEQGLEASQVEGAPDEDGVVPLYLKGRSTGEHANITVRQDPEELRTRVRVIWRTYADAPDRNTDQNTDQDGDEA